MAFATSVITLIGRSDLTELTVGVALRADGAPGALVLLGDPGIGKSTLLLHAADAAAAAGTTILPAAGGLPEPPGPFGSLAELLCPVLEMAPQLPAPLADALATVVGRQHRDRAPDLICPAVAALLRAAGTRAPVLLAVDDADRMDRQSWSVLAGVLRRLAGAPVAALLTARRREELTGLDNAVAVLEVPPLAPPAAVQLLESQAGRPADAVRGEILRWAAGNPLALVEAARQYSRTGATRFSALEAAGPGSADPVIAAQWAGLCGDARRLLLFAAVASGRESAEVLSRAAGFGGDLRGWGQAVDSGLVRLGAGQRVEFCHPLARGAVYHAGSVEDRRAAQLALAAIGDPAARAWLRAAAATGPDESVASALHGSAGESFRRGGYLDVARRLQRAAELSEQPAVAAHRYAIAAAAANCGGDVDWARTALDDATAADCGQPAPAVLARASILIQSGCPADAFGTLKAALDGGHPPREATALGLLYLAGNAAYYSGDPEHLRDLNRWARLAEHGGPAGDALPLPFPPEMATLQRAYVDMYCTAAVSGRPGNWDRTLLEPGPEAAEAHRMLITGVMAYAGEHSALAARQLGGAIDRLNRTGGLRGFTYATAPLAWALLDTGRWTELTALLDGAGGAAVRPLGLVASETAACRAMLYSLRGDPDRGRAVLPDIGAVGQSRATLVARHRAAGWIAVADNDFDGAYRQWRQVFDADGVAAHFVVSWRSIADLAWAAARSGRTAQVRGLLRGIGRNLGSDPPARLRLLRHQALGLVAGTQAAERHFHRAVTDPAGDEWPLERARAMLHYGEWLRRARRPGDARGVLTAAQQVFERLGAEPLRVIAADELRAAGVGTGAAQHGGWDQLTAQEHKIVMLAAAGLTNREIGERLNLSPRTIGSHLYHVYPKLGVSRRHELREAAFGSPDR